MPRLIACDLKPEERCLKVIRAGTAEEIERPVAIDTDEKWVEVIEPNPDQGSDAARTARLAAGVDPVLAASLHVCKYKMRLDPEGHAELAPMRLYIDFDVFHKVTGEVLYRVRQRR